MQSLSAAYIEGSFLEDNIGLACYMELNVGLQRNVKKLKFVWRRITCLKGCMKFLEIIELERNTLEAI